MSILIKGIEMPTSCYVCPFCDYVSARCDAVKGNPYTTESRYEKRADFCPLVEIQQHGRLGDLDALAESVENPGIFPPVCSSEVFEFLRNAPTIIQAEEGE